MCTAAFVVNGMLVRLARHIHLQKKEEKIDGFHVPIFHVAGS